MSTPILQVPLQPNFMVVGGKTYFVKEVQESPEDLLKDVTKYYEESLTNLKESLAAHVSVENRVDLDAQLRRIERHMSTQTVAIPDFLQGRHGGPAVYSNGRLFEPRLLLFKPTRITCTLSHILDVKTMVLSLSRKDQERFTGFMAWAEPVLQSYSALPRPNLSGTKVDTILDQDLFVSAMIACYDAQARNVKVFPREVHPHVFPEGNLCTGNADPLVFWDDPGFVSNFNGLNPHSFANSNTEAAQRYRELFKNKYFVSASIRGEEAAGWRVS